MKQKKKLTQYKGNLKNPIGTLASQKSINPTIKQSSRGAAIQVIREAAKSWPEFIPRTQIPKVTNGLYSVGHMANCDSRGTGVKGAFTLGRQKIYPREVPPDGGLVNWLISLLGV